MTEKEEEGVLYKEEPHTTKRANKYNEDKSDPQFRNMRITGKRFKGGWEIEGVEKYREV